MTGLVLPLADQNAALETVGGKGASLARLANAGLPVPCGFHVTTAAYKQFVVMNNLQPAILEILKKADPAQPSTLEAASSAIHDLFRQAEMPREIAEAIADAYRTLDGGAAVVAVRSSATAEDLPDLSFAGQQETFLNICGQEAVLQAVQKCWASLWTARAIGYRLQHHIDQDVVSLAVVVQRLVPAEAAGILFTANPINGQRDQAMITATWGLGEAIVGGMVTPDTLIVEKASGRVLSRETADKQVMTVRIEGGTEEQPVPEAMRRAPVLSDSEVSELAKFGGQIEKLYGMPMDIEWTLAEEKFAIVQARPITALPEPELPAPTEWKLPRGDYAAMRNNIVELMADPMSPLFATLGLSAINTSLHRIMNESFAMRGVMPEEIIIVVNHYAYNNGSLSLKGLVYVLVNAGKIMKAMFTGAVERWTEAGRPRYYETVESWQAKNWRAFSSVELVDSAKQLTESAIDAYAALVAGVIPAAWITEALFTTVYDRLIKRRSDPSAPIYLLGYDSLPIRADKSLYSLADWARQHPALRDYLERAPTSQLADLGETYGSPPGDVPPTIWQEWRGRFREHLQKFGQALYDLDFAHPVPADDPAPVLEAFKLYLRGQGVDPHTRQQESEKRREQAVQATTQRLKGWRLYLFNKFLAPAQKYAPLREDGLAEIGLAYPLIRQMLRELGRRFAHTCPGAARQRGAVGRSVIVKADDIFWLTEDEVLLTAKQLDAGQPAESLAEKIPQRKAERQAAMRVSPPMALPQMKVFGFDLMSLRDRRGRGGTGEAIKGVACSAGRVTGTARVLHGPDEFSQMKPGDVLVASITTPAWTPLFAMASAVVTDVGGPLSHGSIVAREYGIPAVLGTGVATRRIHSGDTITVDGTEGKVYLKARGTPTGGPAIEWRLPNPKGQYMRGSIVDMMPDPLSPLFATLGLRAIARVGIKQVMEPLTRSEPDLPDDYILTINDYAYMGVAFTPHQWWWILTKMLLAFPRIIREALPLWRDEIRPRYAASVAHWQIKPLEKLTLAELWAGIQEVNDAAMLHLASLMVATTGASAGSEMLFTRVYQKMAQRHGDPTAVTFLMGYDSTPIQAEKSLYDLASWCRERDGLAAYIQQTPAHQLAAQLAEAPRTPGEAVGANDWPAFQARFQAHQQAYGHIMYDLDFAKPLPLDDPAPMLETVKMYLRGEGVNPHERQRAAEEKRVRAAETTLNRLRGLRRWAFHKTLGMAQTMAQVRENALADIGLGYPLLRQMLRELGRRFVPAGIITQGEDIFWLEADEVREAVAALERGESLVSLAERVARRKTTHAALKRVTPPPMLPPKEKYMGFDMETFTPATAESQTGNTLKGVAASAGKVTAPACVLHGPEDFDQMRPGAVLVAGTTTPAWTPLFAMASAVVTDIGGPLSHGSIVAREYGIPAVMGTGVATRRIRSGQMITVDGSAGTVELK
ncbi:MAG TPA: PEP/pyruvate-binding domain-containing protein [Anaerolineales bacterium]|nr:PEP/pyruvate-binding domain-containing protein [Anaerolineales bacterium]